MLGLFLTATLEGVTDLFFMDDPTDPYIFTCQIQCTSCREVHPNLITFNQYEEHEIPGSRGEANFIFHCHMCRKQSSATVKQLHKPYTIEDSGKPVNLMTIGARGLDIKEFKADGKFKCVGVESGTKFDEVDIEDSEWYDYDEKAGSEVSVTEIKWEVKKI